MHNVCLIPNVGGTLCCNINFYADQYVKKKRKDLETSDFFTFIDKKLFELLVD